MSIDQRAVITDEADDHPSPAAAAPAPACEPGDLHDDPSSGSMSPRAGDPTREDRSPRELDDHDDREELQDRYYGLLQELRVLLPGVQILVAFLFTVPFADGFDQLDEAGRDLYAVALVSSILAVIAFTTPTAFHRIGERRSRSVRLEWGIRTTRAGLVLFAIALVSALILVTRVVLSVPLAVAAIGVVVVALLGMWVALPLLTSRERGADPQD